MTAEPITARTLADLPEARQAHLGWLLRKTPNVGPEMDLSALDNLCTRVSSPAIADRAVLDTFGEWHLLTGSEAACKNYGYPWQPSPDGEEKGDLLSIPFALRCPHCKHYWPPTLTGAGALAKIRRALVEALGPMCSTCGDWARHVDHDHYTGAVRGYLCGSCNTSVDWCHHVSGCHFAEYITTPPARALGLTYRR